MSLIDRGSNRYNKISTYWVKVFWIKEMGKSMKYRYVVDYKEDKVLRESFNTLAIKTFDISFNSWYEKGLWGDQYIPYSLVDHNKVIANISVNLMRFQQDGIAKNYIQLGTVMIDEAYRGQGLSRFLMEQILAEYKDKVDGIYLFGNDSVLEFYPKFGFKPAKEYRYSKKVCIKGNMKTAQKVDMSECSNWEKLFTASKTAELNGRLAMSNQGLLGFWITGYKKNSIYYMPEQKAYVIADIENEVLTLHEIFAGQRLALDEVITAFGSGIKEVILGFTPYVIEGYTIKPYHEEDCTLFIIGDNLKIVEEQKLMFPTVSHA